MPNGANTMLKYICIGSFIFFAVSLKNTSCANDCSGNGDCLDGKCLCQQSFIGESCEIFAQRLVKNLETINTISGGTSIFYYILVSVDTGDLKLHIKKDMGTLYIFFLFENTRSSGSVPSYESFSYKNVIYPDVLDQTLKIQGNTFQNLSFNSTRFIIGCYTADNHTEMTLGLTISSIAQGGSSDDQKIMIVYILIGFTILIFCFWALLTFIRYRNRRNRLNERDKAEANKLTVEIIEKFMPRKNYLEIKEKVNEPHCAVCLVEFDDKDQLRKTVCLHTFHQECIDKWLQKQESCPYCRKGLSGKELEEWDKEKQKKSVEKIIEIANILPKSPVGAQQAGDLSIFNTSGLELNLNYHPGMVGDESRNKLPVNADDAEKKKAEGIVGGNDENLEKGEKLTPNDVQENMNPLEKRQSANIDEIQNDFEELEKMINTSMNQSFDSHKIRIE